MLRQRVLTALVLGPLAIGATLLLPSPWFAAVLGLVFCLGAWEWAGLSGLRQRAARHLYVALFIALVVGLLYAELSRDIIRLTLLPMAASATLWWAAAVLFILVYPRGSALWTSYPSTVSMAGIFTLLPGWLALAGLHWYLGPGYALLLMGLVWGADIGAYFAGKTFGRRKLAPAVSPGKTWAGVWGGLAAAVWVAIGGAVILGLPLADWPALLLASLLAVIASVVGDLSESMFKRLAGVKDSGHLLPGHGGILDRIDSLTAAAPVFVLGLLWPILI